MRVISNSENKQQDLLRNAKEILGITWDELAIRAGIAPRALKTYRMPDESDNYRTMPSLARKAILNLIDDFKNKNNRNQA